MQIEIKLQKVLADHGLDSHGITQQIATELGLHRHTLRKLYNNTTSNPSLKILGSLCDWLVKHRVPAKILPQALFGMGSSNLWEVVAAPGMVRIYLGEYRQFKTNAHIPWISRRDASVQSSLVSWLSKAGVCGDSKVEIDTAYLPFRVDESSKRIMKKDLEHDYATAIRTYRKMRSELNHSSAVLVGSQRINRLVETYVADLFGCTPFVADARRARVPFFLAYQNRLRPVESVFGGLNNPPGVGGKFIKGTHYLNAEGKWACIPWIDGEQDSGIIVTSRERHNKGCTLAVIGLSGKASEALGRYLTSNAAPFWPPYADKGGRKVGVYICKIVYRPNPSSELDDASYAKEVEVVPIDTAILNRYLKAK